MKKQHFICFFLLVSVALVQVHGLHAIAEETAQSNQQPHKFKLGSMNAVYPLVGIPQDDVNGVIIPGLQQQAAAISILSQMAYSGNPTDFDKTPKLKKMKLAVMKSPGFWPELVGSNILKRPFARIYGPDIWRVEKTNLQNKIEKQYVIGEGSGGNPGGNDSLQGYAEYVKSNAGFGDVPYFGSFYEQMIERVRTLARREGKPNPVIVYLDEMSRERPATKDLNANKVDLDLIKNNQGFEYVKPEKQKTNGKEVLSLPFEVADSIIDNVQKGIESAGAIFLSAVDDVNVTRDGVRRLYVRNQELFVLDKEGVEKKVDALVTGVDIESIDPLHKPQHQRNIDAGSQSSINNYPLVGIPGLIEAYIKPEKSFIWANDPRTLLTKSKLTPPAIDAVIEAHTGKAPILPSSHTEFLFDEDGKLDQEKLATILKNKSNYVFKYTIGSGGKQIYIGNLTDEATLKSKVLDLVKENPFAVLVQPFVELGRLIIDVNNDPRGRPFDLRMNIFFVGGSTFDVDSSTIDPVVFSHVMMLRTAPDGSLLTNISSGGFLSMAIPHAGSQIEFAQPLPRIGSTISAYPFKISQTELNTLKEDAGVRSLILANLVRDLYNETNREKLLDKFPVLRHILKRSIYFNDIYLKKAGSNHTTSFYSGTDYIVTEQGLRATEENTTSIGGWPRLWQMGIGEPVEYMKKSIDAWRKLDPSKENHYAVYYVEKDYFGGLPWDEFRKKFRTAFGVELASDTEKERFQVVGSELYYTDDTGKANKVTQIIAHIEPDFLDPKNISRSKFDDVIPEKELDGKLSYGIAGLFDTQIHFVNAPGTDMSCSKTVFPLMEELATYYGLKLNIDNAKSFNFIDKDGVLNMDLYSRVKENPEAWVIKDGEIIGNGEGVFILRDLSEEKRREVFEKIKIGPWRFIAQQLFDLKRDVLGQSAELRILNTVQVGMGNEGKAELIAQSNIPTVRSSLGSKGNISSLAQQLLPGFYRLPKIVDASCNQLLTLKQ